MFIVPLLLLSHLNCENDLQKENNDHRIYNQIVYPLLDSLDKEHRLREKEIVFGRHESDEMLSLLIKNVNMEFQNDTTGPAKILKKLMRVVKEINEIRLDIDSQEYNLKGEETIKKFDLAKRIHRGKEPNKVIFNVSKIVIDPKSNIGCFYASVDTSNPAGYIIFIFKDDKDIWRIINTIKKWG